MNIYLGQKYSKIFLSPHNDDEILFGAYTLMREKPLVIVVTDSYIQEKRGDKATAEMRRKETEEACRLLRVPVKFLGLRDDEITEDILFEALKDVYGVDTCYAPAFEQDGNPIHNLVSRVADCFFDVKHYMTYNIRETKSVGEYKIIPTKEEKELKTEALKCYPSQLEIPTCKAFFDDKDVINFESYVEEINN
jgi:hypothetical protein